MHALISGSQKVDHELRGIKRMLYAYRMSCSIATHMYNTTCTRAHWRMPWQYCAQVCEVHAFDSGMDTTAMALQKCVVVVIGHAELHTNTCICSCIGNDTMLCTLL